MWGERMGLRLLILLSGVVIGGGIAAAEPAQTASNAPAALASAALSAPAQLRLLDDIPDYAAALASQWGSADVPPGIERFVSDTSRYGRLRELSAPQALTLADCVALALAHNTGLEISRLGPLGARTQVRRAYSIFDPSVFADLTTDRSEQPAGSALQGLTATKGRSESINLTGDLGLRKLLRSGAQVSLMLRTNRMNNSSAFMTDFVPQYRSDLTLQLAQPMLRDFGLRFTTLQVRIARTESQSALKQYEATLATTVKTVEQAYWALVQANHNVTVQEQGLALAKELQRQNEGRFNVGAAPRTAVLEAQAEVARRETNLIQARSARINARDALRALINASPDSAESLLVVEPADAPAVEPYSVDLERSLATALERRPELAAAKLAVQGAGMQLKLAENQLLPRLNALGSFGTTGLSGKGRKIDALTGQPKPQNPFTGAYGETYNGLIDGRYYSYSAGLTLEVPLSNAQARADYAAVRVSVEQARLSLQQLQENVTLEVKRAVSNLETDIKSIEATRIARELAEENLRNQKARYDVGLATTKDLLDFQDRLTIARATEIQALVTYNVDLAELRRVEGSLLEARHVQVTDSDSEPTPFWAQF
ncbi:MAG: TolC family protein [Deltaproteobacteria bacterium]|nr:TolC family protein [Deltaproteobacteria bacterium]